MFNLAIDSKLRACDLVRRGLAMDSDRELRHFVGMFDFRKWAHSSNLRLLAGVVWFLTMGTLFAHSGPADIAEGNPAGGDSDVRIPLNIPSQPLEDALYAFGAATGIEIIADGGAVTDRRSAEVKGTLSVQQALRILLTGTGLDAHPIGARAITLSRGQQEPSKTSILRNYSAILQNAALRQLCGEKDIRFGTYRIAMQLWLDQTGNVERVELLSSTGDRARDLRISQLLKGISGAKPPEMMPQPVVMVILPRSTADSGDCINSAGPPPLDIGDRRQPNR